VHDKIYNGLIIQNSCNSKVIVNHKKSIIFLKKSHILKAVMSDA